MILLPNCGITSVVADSHSWENQLLGVQVNVGSEGSEQSPETLVCDGGSQSQTTNFLYSEQHCIAEDRCDVTSLGPIYSFLPFILIRQIQNKLHLSSEVARH